MDNRPIGVFDSGLGGLTVWRQLRRELPHESLCYFGDGANCPYGDKSREEVLGYVIEAVERLLNENIKMLVVACNAATAYTIDYLRSHYSMPIVGMEPAVKPAVLSTKSGIVGILATSATLKGNLFHRTSVKYADRATIMSAVGEGFVELVENDMEGTQEAVETVRRVIEPMIERGADKLVLGCTHYPMLSQAMRKVIGDRGVELIDPAPAVERRVAQLLKENGIEASKDNQPVYRFMTASDEVYRMRLEYKAQSLL